MVLVAGLEASLVSLRTYHGPHLQIAGRVEEWWFFVRGSGASREPSNCLNGLRFWSV